MRLTDEAEKQVCRNQRNLSTLGTMNIEIYLVRDVFEIPERTM